jgi:hypothetical protein
MATTIRIAVKVRASVGFLASDASNARGRVQTPERSQDAERILRSRIIGNQKGQSGKQRQEDSFRALQRFHWKAGNLGVPKKAGQERPRAKMAD